MIRLMSEDIRYSFKNIYINIYIQKQYNIEKKMESKTQGIKNSRDEKQQQKPRKSIEKVIWDNQKKKKKLYFWMYIYCC